MYFDEGRHLNHVHCRESKTPDQIGSVPQLAHNSSFSREDRPSPSVPLTSAGSRSSSAGDAVDAARNKLQELMQLFYLLSRDSRVPQDARYHVTVAQSEMALLSKILQNNTETAAPFGNSPDGWSTTHF